MLSKTMLKMLKKNNTAQAPLKRGLGCVEEITLLKFSPPKTSRFDKPQSSKTSNKVDKGMYVKFNAGIGKYLIDFDLKIKYLF